MTEWPLRALVRLLPTAFRQRHGEDLIECHRDAWHEEAEGRGLVRRVAFWWRALTTTATTVARVRWSRPERTRTEAEGTMGIDWDGWRHDFRLTVRRLARRPGFGLVVAATLGLGLGANVAVFSVLHSVLLAPLPYEELEQLVRVYGTRRDIPDANLRNYLPAPAAHELRDRVRGLASVAILENYSAEGADLTDGDRPERVRRLRVSAEYFATLGVSPLAGRGFVRDEETADSRVVVLREAIWQRYLGGSLEAIGSTLTLDGEPFTVVGVVPDAFRDPLEGQVDLWTPADLWGDNTDYWGNNYLTAVARLAPGTEVGELRAELEVLADAHADISSEAAEKGFTVIPLRDDVVGSSRPLLTAIMGAVAFLLLLTCVNVASLLLARATARERELAIRSSLGAGRPALVRQFVLETGLLALAGGVVGVVLGQVALDAITALAPAGLPRREGIGLGVEAVYLAGIASVLMGVGLGLVTGLPFTRPRTDRVVTGMRSAGGSPRARVRSSLVVAEVSLAVVLVVGAGVLLRTVQRLQSRDLGADPAGVLTFTVGLPDARYGDDAAIYGFHERFHERLAALPGVVSAGSISRLPVTGTYNTWGTRRAHGPDEPMDVPNTSVNQRWVAGDFFRTAGLELLSGRVFDEGDRPEDPYKVVINRALVGALYGDEEALGSWLLIGGRYTQVIGIVEDNPLSPRGGPAPTAYHHQRQWIGGDRGSTEMVRVQGDPTDLVPAVRAALAEIDPELVLYRPETYREVLAAGIEQERFAAKLLAVFAGLALFLAGLGLYGIMTHVVGRQRHEIGVRIALGADTTGVVGLIVGRSFRLTAAGAAIGLLVALGVAGTLESLLFEVSARDPVVLIGTPVVLLVVAALSSWLPARRASRVDPVEAFRAE